MAIPLAAMPAWRNPSDVSQGRIVDEERQAESAANAGEPTIDHASIPLTATGLEQALSAKPSSSSDSTASTATSPSISWIVLSGSNQE